MTPPKAEYIGADQLPYFVFRLQLCGGPYIPRMRFPGLEIRSKWKSWHTLGIVTNTDMRQHGQLQRVSIGWDNGNLTNIHRGGRHRWTDRSACTPTFRLSSLGL